VGTTELAWGIAAARRACRKTSKIANGHHFVNSINCIVERRGRIWLSGKRTNPFAAFADQTAKRPGRQFQFDQSQRGIRPGSRLDQAIKVCSLSRLRENWNAGAGAADDFGKKTRRRPRRKPKLLIQSLEKNLAIGTEGDDTASRLEDLSVVAS
jgi:hypothetical protein